MHQMYPKNGRVILHVDMNSFYASVEMAYDSTLKGKPLAIAGNPKERRGIIVTCSYEARAKGVKTTMPLWEARKLCPELIVRKPNFPRYRKASIEMFQILGRFSHLVQPVSIDEGYVDITESHHLGNPIEIAKKIQKIVMDELSLPCSIGIAPNKFLAKMASDMKKPMGITILRKRDVPKVLWPLPVQEMHGVGSKTAEKLKTIKIETIKDLANADEYQVRQLLGINGTRLKERANGIDQSKVDPDAVSEFKSIGNSTTLSHDSTDREELLRVLNKLSELVCTRMKRQDLVAWNVQLMIRFSNRKTITRSKKQKNPIYNQQDIFNVAKYLFEEHWDGEPIRLLGVTVHDLEEKEDMTKQLDLFSFEKDAKDEPLLNTLQQLQEKYGENILQKGIKLKNNVEGEGSKEKGTSFQKDFLRDLDFNQKNES